MHDISRDYTFCAAHQIEDHPKCGRIHGHNYEVTVSLIGEVSTKTGMVMDFGVLDMYVKPVIEAMDHRYLVSESNQIAKNPQAAIAIEKDQAYVLFASHSTAERIAEHIAYKVYNQMPVKFNVRVMVRETPKSTATFVIWHETD